ncbi:MAG: hypothetical protein WC220_03195 [Pedobacter sp.]|jgi:hypothetical protein
MRNAGIPNQCCSNDDLNSACIKNRIERPNPQPGHQLKPRFSSGQRLECAEPEAVNARNNKALTQAINSKGKLNINRENRFSFIEPLKDSEISPDLQEINIA